MNQIENKLTPAANNALEEILKDYKEQILISAEKSASEVTNEIREISIRDILNGVESLDISLKDKKKKAYERRILLIGVIGVTYAFTGQIFNFIYNKESINNTFNIVGLVGIIIALFALFYFLYRSNRQSSRRSFSKFNTNSNQDDLSLIFIKKWTQIELLAKDIMASTFGESKANMPISFLFEFLIDRKLLDEKDFYALKILLQKRNEILHSEKEFNESELKENIIIADQIFEKLRITSKSTGRRE